ncbi:hypothetical protein BCR43DRAFT_488068, partial [Syncephalastrum racemosum]
MIRSVPAYRQPSKLHYSIKDIMHVCLLCVTRLFGLFFILKVEDYYSETTEKLQLSCSLWF